MAVPSKFVGIGHILPGIGVERTVVRLPSFSPYSETPVLVFKQLYFADISISFLNTHTKNDVEPDIVPRKRIEKKEKMKNDSQVKNGLMKSENLNKNRI